MTFIISHKVSLKLIKKHGIKISEIEECFFNRVKGFLEDKREQNKTIPPTQWFIAKTDSMRLLKIVFIELSGAIIIKTAYEPNYEEVRIYEKHA
ncbi:MAG: ADP-ribosyl-(dinitrogen reductase) hydrolase [Gammaproteobacteria bacterium]|nr:ADP-ribosyl-(dinitrogen reductase) hydrolase [Gammaproteobacteria bacterium]